MIVERDGILNVEIIEGAWWEAVEGGGDVGWNRGVRVMFGRERRKK